MLWLGHTLDEAVNFEGFHLVTESFPVSLKKVDRITNQSTINTLESLILIYIQSTVCTNKISAAFPEN